MSAKFFIPKPDVTDLTLPNTVNGKVEGTFPAYQSGDDLLKWSGAFPLPAIGDRVYITNIGWAIVKGYFSEAGFLGCMTLAENPPEWLKKQRERDLKSPRKQPEWITMGIGCEFGAELSLTEPKRRAV